jgi:DNA replication protein DnaC
MTDTTTTGPLVTRYCTFCQGEFDETGKRLYGDDRADSVKPFLCDQCKPRVLSDRRIKANIPAGLTGLRFNDTTTGPAADAARQWGAGEINGVLLCGPVGVGKTHLAACAINQRLERGQVKWVSVPSMIARALAAFDSEERKQATTELTGRGGIVLDDLDKVKPSDWALSQLFVAIDTRVTAGAPLFVTTNMQPGEIAKTFGEAIASRLVGHCLVRKLDGQDRRLQGRPQ